MSNGVAESPSRVLSDAEQLRQRKEYLLAELRCSALRVRLIAADIDAVGLALKHGFINADEALIHLHELDVLQIIGVPLPERDETV